jgi:Na+-transporting NADH:ubiquinone oxidoreductase subunit NqrD
MQSMLPIGMALALASFMGLVGTVCIAGILVSVVSENHSLTWAALKERIPSFLALMPLLVLVALLVYAVLFLMRNYGG